MLSICRSSFFHHLNNPRKRSYCDLSLYLVANRPSFHDENLFYSKISESVKGGVSCVQLRDHQNDLASTIKTAARLKLILKEVPLFINTLHSFEVMQAVKAEGVYLEEKFSYQEARKLLGQKAIIGIPVKTLEDVITAETSDEIDYLSVKVLRSKKTCPKNDALWGPEGLKNIRTLSSHRIVAIGGLNLACVESIYRQLHLDDGVAMAGGIMREENPLQIAQQIQLIRNKIKEEL